MLHRAPAKWYFVGRGGIAATPAGAGLRHRSKRFPTKTLLIPYFYAKCLIISDVYVVNDVYAKWYERI